MKGCAYCCPTCLHGRYEGRAIVMWRQAGWMIECPGGKLRATATGEAGPALWTCYGGCKPAHVVTSGSQLARRLDRVTARAERTS